MMKMKKLLTAAAILAVLLCALAVTASAAGTVVFLSGDGTGDGSSPQSPVSTMMAAYDALDLSADCTVVLVGEYAQSEAFLYTKEYTGTVTVTSVYGGVDYRKTAGAAYTSIASRYICTGDLTFRDLDFFFSGAYYYVIGNHHNVTIDTGVTMESSNASFNGTAVANGFAIAGGYQSKQPIFGDSDELPPTVSDKPTNVTVRSGSNIVILAYSRQIKDINYSGKATITVEGDAAVGTIFFAPVNAEFSSDADVVLNIGGNAVVDSIYGGTSAGTLGSVTLNWNSGEIGFFGQSNRDGIEVTAARGYTLNVGSGAKESTFLNRIATKFDTVNNVDTPAAGKTVVKLTIGQAIGYVNGEGKTLDVAPIIRNDRTMLPVRFLAEAFGAQVGWDGATSTATLKADGVDVQITIGAASAKINGETVALDSPAFIENNRTYLPVRVIASALGAAVEWDGATSTATLTK